MNIFVTSFDVNNCAYNHCKVHVRKMIVEYAQLLSTAHHVLDGKYAIDGIYKESHTNHPCAIWVRECSGNYHWLFLLFKRLCSIYAKNEGKSHKTSHLISRLFHLPKNIAQEVTMSIPPQCMPDDFKDDDVCYAYEQYLESKYEQWSLRDRPIKVEFYKR